MDAKDFDDLLQFLGTGRWNFFFYSCMSIAFFTMPCYVFASSFMTPGTPHSCILPSSLNDSEIYFTDNNCTYMYYNDEVASNITEKCTSWTYDQLDSIESLTSEFDLVCDKAYLRPTYQTLQMCGSWFGALANGYLADRHGRTKVIFTSIFLLLILSFISSFLKNFVAILVLRLCIGLCSSAVFQIGYILCMEITAPKQRSTVGIVISLPWAFGMMWWGALGYLVRDWRWLQRVSEAPFLIVVILLLFMSESPRWLILRGHHMRALNCIKKAAKWNKKLLPGDTQMKVILKRMQEKALSKSTEYLASDEEQKKTFYKLNMALGEVFKLFTFPEVRKRTLLMMLVFVVTATVYIGLILNAVNFNLNPYMYMFIGGAVEIPAYTIIAPIVAKYGRIKPTAICFFYCGVAIMILAFIPQDNKYVIIAFAMTGRFANAAAFQIVFLIASEVFPTDVRIRAMGTLSFVSTLSATAPYITELLGAVYPWLPSIIFGFLSFTATVAVVFLPETVDVHLPETIAQLEKESKLNKLKRESKKLEEMVKLNAI